MRYILLALAILALSGCASFGRSLKNFLGGGEPPQKGQAAGGPSTSFSAQSNVMTGKPRKYKRVTADNFSDGESLEDNSGSLWKKEGQGSFLFSQNSLRVMGDIINLEIEGKAAENLTTKLKIIKAAIARRYAPTRLPARAGAVGKVPKPEGETPAAGAEAGAQATAGAANKDGAQAQASQGAEKPAEPDLGETKFDAVSCRIIEKNRDGSYRVKGQQTIYVGSFEYKLIVTGVVRPDDISTDNVKSTQLIDSKYDLVASNKEPSREQPR